ncbi:MAG: Cof-type HAD-IIB family hydrolase [Ruminiclostridium sp.]
MDFTGKMLICDMDGTLLNSNSLISKENCAAIEYFKDRGGRFTIATGRMLKSVVPYLEKIHVNAPIILYNGAMIYDFDKQTILWDIFLDGLISELVTKLFDKFPNIGLEVFHGHELYILRENEETRAHLLWEALVPSIANFEDIPSQWYKVLIAANPCLLQEVEKYLEEMKKLYAFRYVYSEPQFIEVLPPNVSKGSTLTELIKILGISCTNVTAVGDSYNDIEMIITAGTGVAVANACQALKDVACYTCVDNNEHCVSDIINRLTLSL